MWREDDAGAELFNSWKTKQKQAAKRGLSVRHSLYLSARYSLYLHVFWTFFL